MLVLLFSLAQQGSIGSRNSETAATPSRVQLFYLDTANPATCSGTITRWRVCYYGPDAVNSSGSYRTTYAVYRRMGSGDRVRYMRVSETFNALRTVERFLSADIADGEIAQGGFNCYTDSIDADDSSITVEAGDIIGAYLFGPGDSIRRNINLTLVRLALDVVDEASGDSLLQMDTSGCSRSDIPSDILANQLSIINSRRLHIHANIGKLYLSTKTIETMV